MAIVPIVEGHAEVESIPVLLRRLAPALDVARPFRVKRNRVVKPGELERAIALAQQDRRDPTGILVVLDADDDCPATLAPSLLERCRRVTELPCAVVIANHEIEAWLLGGVSGLRGHRGVREDANWTGDPEAPRGAKGCLEGLMAGRSYVDVDDQPALMAQVDVVAAMRRCPSFEKLVRDLSALAPLEFNPPP